MLNYLIVFQKASVYTRTITSC